MDLERFVRIAVLTGVFATPFLGLIVASELFFPFITGKNFAFRIIVEIIFALWLMLALYRPEYRPRWSLALALAAAFVVSVGVSTVLAENPFKAFWSNFERMEGYITILHLAAYVTVLTSMLRTEELWKRFFLTSLGASVIVALYSLFQLSGAFAINQGGLRIDATFGNATYFAVYMLIHAFLALYALARWARARWQQVALVAIFALESVLVFYSATRGTILGLAGGLFLAGLVLAFSRGAQPLVRKAGIAAVMAVLVAAGGFYAIKDTQYVVEHPILSRIASISLEAGETRFQIWNMAWQGFQERPLFGWGQEGFNFVFNKYYTPDLYQQEPWFDRAHNVVLDWLVAGGVLGATLYLSLYAILVWYLWRRGNPFASSERAILTGLLAAYGFHNLFVFDNLMSYVLFTALLSYITVRAVPPHAWGVPLKSEHLRVAVPVVGVLALLGLYFINFAGLQNASGIIEALKPHEEGIDTNVRYMKAAVERGGLGSQEVHEQLLQFVAQVRQLGIGSAEFQSELATYARDHFLEELQKSPNDARLLIFLGSFLRQFGDFANAESAMRSALAATPQKQTAYFELGLTEIAAGKYPEALETFRTAYELEPNFDQARGYYALGLIYAGRVSEAESNLLEWYGTITPDNPILLQAYLDTGRYTEAIRLAESRIALRPSEARPLLDLAAILLQAGRRLESVQAIRRAMALDPSFAPQGEQFIAEIEAGRNP